MPPSRLRSESLFAPLHLCRPEGLIPDSDVPVRDRRVLGERASSVPEG